MAFCLVLLLICGDISSNPGPGTADMFGDIKEQLRGNGIKIAHINVRGLMNKFTDVTLLVHWPKLDILVVTETHLDSSISDDTIKIEGYSVQRCDRDKHGGGCLIYYQEHLNITVMDNIDT